MAKFESKSFNPQAFGVYVERIPQLKKNELVKSNVLKGNTEIRNAFSSQTGTAYAILPMYGLLDGDVLNYDGQTDLTATSTTTYERGVVVIGRAKAWVEGDFAVDITGGVDFMDNVAQQVSEYFDEVDQGTLLAILEGIFAMTGKANEEFTKKHVGIYIGNGKMRHVWTKGKVCETSINVAKGYRGWGWHGGKKPSGAGETSANTSSEKVSASDSDSETTDTEKVELCSTSVVSTITTGSTARERLYRNIVNGLGTTNELHIINGDVDYIPLVKDSVEWSTEWMDAPGSLTFTIVNDKQISILEGNIVIFKRENKNVFYGYLFKKSKNKDGTIKCTAYDQLRYFKNKDTYCYKNRKYSDLIKLIANDYFLYCGEISDTKYAIPGRVEDDVSLFDIFKNARVDTLSATGELFLLYDNFGKLDLKNIKEMATDILIDKATAKDFDYSTSIDDNVYNRIHLYRDDDTTGNRAKYIYENGDCINSWGVLQKTFKLEEGDNPSTYGQALLNMYCRKLRELDIKNAFGDVRLRAGASVYVTLDVGDIVYDNALFVITSAVHKFESSSYTCDLTLAGGLLNEFTGEI